MACRSATICLVLVTTSCMARRTNIDDSSALEVFTGGVAGVAQGSALNLSNNEEAPPMQWARKAAEKASLAASALSNPKSTQWWKSVETVTRQMASEDRIDDMAGIILERLAEVKDIGERKSHIAFALSQADISSKSTPTLEQLTNRLLVVVEQWIMTGEKDKHYVKLLSRDALQDAVRKLGAMFRVSDGSVCKQAAFFLILFEKLLPTLKQSKILQESLKVQHLMEAARKWVNELDDANLRAWYTQCNARDTSQAAKDFKMRGELTSALLPLSMINELYQSAELILDEAKKWIGERLKAVLIDNSFVSLKNEGVATLTRQNLPLLPGCLQELPLNFEDDIVTFARTLSFSCPQSSQKAIDLALPLGYNAALSKFDNTRALLRQAWLGKLNGVGQPVKQDEGALKERLKELEKIAVKMHALLPSTLQARLSKVQSNGETVQTEELMRLKEELIAIIMLKREAVWVDEDEKKAA